MLNKVFKYIETEELADTLKFSADDEDAGYRLGGKGSTTIGTPDILWENIAFIQDKKIIWTHGEFYCQIDLSAYATNTYLQSAYTYLINTIADNELIFAQTTYALDNRINVLENTEYLTEIPNTYATYSAIEEMGYITMQDISAQSYLTEIPNDYPTYAAIDAMGYTTYAYIQTTYNDIINIITDGEEATVSALLDLHERLVYIEELDIANSIDLSTYVTKTELSAQSYLQEIPNTYVTYDAIDIMGYATYSYVQAAYSYVLNTILNNKFVIATALNSHNDRIDILETAGYLTSQDISGLASETYVTTKVADLVDSAPSTLNTLNELATALGNDENFATTVATQIGEKVSKTELEGLGYITYTQLSAQGYLTSVPNTYPTYTAIEAMGYVTQTSLSENSYAGYSYVYSAYAYILDKLQNVNTNVNIDLSSYAGYSYVYSAYAYILNIINEDELVTSTALNDHNTRINETYSYVQSAYAYLLNEIYDNEYVTAYGLIQLNERIETLEENVGDVDFDQYALKTTLNSYVTYNNAKKWYPSYSYVETYYTTYTYLDQRLSTIDLSTYVSKSELTAQSYVTKAELSSQSYLTAVPNTYPTYAAISDMGYVTQTSLSANSYAGYAYVYAAYTYIINSIVDNELVVAQTVLDLNNRVIVLESAGYVTNTQLSNQGYITQTALSNNSYAGYTYVYDSYAYIMGKINTLELATGGGGSGTVAQDGITAISFNGTAASITGSVATIVAPINDPTVQIQIDSATYSFTLNQSTGYTINLGSVIRSHQDLSTYVSKTELSGQSYVASSTLNNYVSKTELSAAGYITSGLPSVTSSDNGKILMVVNGTWQLVSPATIYSGNATPSNANGNNGDIYIQS